VTRVAIKTAIARYRQLPERLKVVVTEAAEVQMKIRKVAVRMVLPARGKQMVEVLLEMSKFPSLAVTFQNKMLRV
jgi:hypothetical protein